MSAFMIRMASNMFNSLEDTPPYFMIITDVLEYISLLRTSYLMIVIALMSMLMY